MTVEEYIIENGPILSSQLIQYFEKDGLTKDAIRKRLSRINFPVLRIMGFFKDNQVFFYHKDQKNQEIFYEKLREAFKTSAKKYYSIIIALEYHNGYIKKEHLASYCFIPINNLKSHKNFETVISDLKKLEVVFEEEDYYRLSNLISRRKSNSNFNYYKAIELAKSIVLNQFHNYTKSIGLISYDKGKLYSEFCKFQFCFTAPSYIAGIVKFKEKIQPAFLIADIVLGNKTNNEDVDFFVQKIRIIKTQTQSNFLPFLITDTITQDAFKKLKENGIIVGFVDKLFGKEYEEFLKSLISTVTNAGSILKQNPDAYLKLISNLDKLVDGKTHNLRGDLFELAVGYYYSNLCQSLDISKKIYYEGEQREIDVYATFQEKIIICECKANKSKIKLETFI